MYIVGQYPRFLRYHNNRFPACISYMYEEKLLIQWSWTLLCLHVFPMSLHFFHRAHWKFLKTVVNKLFEFMHGKLSCVLCFRSSVTLFFFKSSFIETFMIMKSWVFDNVYTLRLVLSASLCHNWLSSFGECHLIPRLLST